mmetsp:Transcript_49045/g.153988  ORF Transcript_49045/g.153988 Transcript_49045/m.153988 type:complete len:215 (+) Transcript_49045:1276-1920(+)
MNSRSERRHPDADGTDLPGCPAVYSLIFLLGKLTHLLGRKALERRLDVDRVPRRQVLLALQKNPLGLVLEPEDGGVHIPLRRAAGTDRAHHGLPEVLLELLEERLVGLADQLPQRDFLASLEGLGGEEPEPDADLLDGLHSQLDRLHHLLVAQEVGGALDHHDRLLGPGHEEVQAGGLERFSRRVDHKLALGVHPDAHACHWRVERDRTGQQRG